MMWPGITCFYLLSRGAPPPLDAVAYAPDRDSTADPLSQRRAAGALDASESELRALYDLCALYALCALRDLCGSFGFRSRFEVQHVFQGLAAANQLPVPFVHEHFRRQRTTIVVRRHGRAVRAAVADRQQVADAERRKRAVAA